jgi:L-threonylcarbamoyladenylate synthase
MGHIHEKITRVISVNALAPEPSVIAQAAEIICSGGLVAFPTETVYGLGANALDPDAVKGIFRAKSRPHTDPLIVHLASAEALPDLVADVPTVVQALSSNFWPGPLTLVLRKSKAVPRIVTAGGPTVAVRVPAHTVALALIRAAGVPIAAPSANRFGQVSPTSSAHVFADLNGRIEMILDGGDTSVGVESTVLSLTTGVPTILRPGGVSLEALQNVLGEVQVQHQQLNENQVALSPGTQLKHYAPQAELTVYLGSRSGVLSAIRTQAEHHLRSGEKVGILVAEEDKAQFNDIPAVIQVLGSLSNLEDVARHLYAALRALDQAGVVVILARDFGGSGLGLAIRDRLTRAAAGRVIRVR